jgi:hypothetical protein
MILYTLALLIILAAIGVVYRRDVKRLAVEYVAPFQWRPCWGIRDDGIYEMCASRIRSGDILSSLSKPTIGCLFTPGQWTHSAICVGTHHGVPLIAEMTGKGFGLVDLREYIRHSRQVIVTRGTTVDRLYGSDMAKRAMAFWYCKYDREFELGDDELSCSELPEAADFENRIIIEPSKIFGQYVITPQDVADATNAEIVFDSRTYQQGSV